METGEMGLVELFGYDKELSLIPPPVSSENCGWQDDERGDMTEEEYYSYRDQVLKTDGFDVDRIPGVSCFHQIEPFNLDDKSWDYEGYSRLAIEEYNFRFKDANAGLEFVKVLKAMGQFAKRLQSWKRMVLGRSSLQWSDMLSLTRRLFRGVKFTEFKMVVKLNAKTIF